jgi:hypothetical protein
VVSHWHPNARIRTVRDVWDVEGQRHTPSGDRDVIKPIPLLLRDNARRYGVTHAVAGHLASDDAPPAGVILIDSHHGTEGRDDRRALALVAADRNRPAELFHGFFSDATMIAGGAYVRIFDGWQPQPSPVPTLLLRAAPTREMRDADPGGDWSPCWPLPHEVVDIPGDHYTMVDGDAGTTAAAMRSWLRELDPAW